MDITPILQKILVYLIIALGVALFTSFLGNRLGRFVFRKRTQAILIGSSDQGNSVNKNR